MLSALLLAGVIAAPIATAALFLPLHGRIRHADEAWRWFGRLALALLWTAVVIAAVVAIMVALGVTAGHLRAAAIGLAAASLAWLPITRRWGARAHVCWSATTYLFVLYLAFMLWWTFASHLGTVGDVGGMILWLLETVAALLGGAYLWELCDALGRASWLRRVGDVQLDEAPDGPYPYVCLQVPCYNEPPEMVIETLRALLALDYPRYEIQLLDDNTDDESLWRPVEAWCREHGVTFVHLSDWPGYKSGALNYALERLVPDECELIGVVDSDYQIEPEFLRECVPLFIDPRVGFVQCPQDYRDWEHAPFYRRLYYSYQYFFAVSQPSRNERDGAIFAGTMGLIRRRAIDEVGGWAEWCITEDAELSFRLLRAGWTGLHVDRSFGRGIMPLTFEALKGQRFRWCFGGIQILRRYWRSMLPGRRTPENHLTFGQRWAYLTGAVQWYGDLLGLLFFLCLLVGAANIVFGAGLVFRKLTGFLVAAIPLLVVLGLVRAVALLRRGTGATWREALGSFFIWQATGVTVAMASVQALFAREAVFLRTPKTHGQQPYRDALKANWVESLLGLLGLAAIGAALASAGGGHGSILVAALLLWPTAGFLAAPYNSVTALRSSLPPDLTARRETEHLRSPRRRLTYAFGGLGLAGGSAAVALALFVPGTTNVAPPQLVGPAQGHPVHYGPPPARASQRRPPPTSAAKATRTRRRTTRKAPPVARTTGSTTTTPTTPTPTPTTPTTPTTTAPTTTTTPATPTATSGTTGTSGTGTTTTAPAGG